MPFPHAVFAILKKRTFIRNTLFLIEVRMQLRDSEPFQGLSDFGT